MNHSKPEPRPNRLRFRLLTIMIVIALCALGLRAPVWWEQTKVWWQERPYRIALARTMGIKLTRFDTLETVLKQAKAASACPDLPNGLPIYVDPIGLQEAEKTLSTTLVSDIDATNLTVDAFLNQVLKPLGLAYGLKDGLITVTSIESLDVPLPP